MDSRWIYLLTRLPPLPGFGETSAVTFPEALAMVRQQGGRDLVLLADALAAEADLRDALDEWVLNPPGSRTAPSGLPAALSALFTEERVAGLPEHVWVEAVWQAWFDLISDIGRGMGSRLLARWAAWETALRRHLAESRGAAQAKSSQDAGGPEGEAQDPFGHASILAAWDSVRERGGAGKGLVAALEAEEVLERARLEFLERESPAYAFTLDELAGYLLRLRLLDRRRRLDADRGRALLRQVAL